MPELDVIAVTWNCVRFFAGKYLLCGAALCGGSAYAMLERFFREYSVMETFFSSMKREELYRTKYRSEKEFKAAVGKYILFYNEKRPHAKNGYKTPAKKEEEFYSN